MEYILSFVLKDQAKNVQEGTFCVPLDCEQISLEYDLSTEYTFLVFMMLIDPNKNVRFLKQLSYSEPVIKLSKLASDTTIGGIPGDYAQGDWTIRLYLFSEYLSHVLQEKTVPFQIKVSDKDLTIKEAIDGTMWVEDQFEYTKYDFDKIYQTQEKWYCGDLHTHTRLSDGKELPKRVNEKNTMMGLDYYIPTEHNTLHTGWPDTKVMIVPGIEITTILGHANIFGLHKMPEALCSILKEKKEEDMKKNLSMILKECKDNNWIFSINHPFLHIWKWLYYDIPLNGIQCLEIVNDPTYEADPTAQAKEANEKAIFLSDMLWEDGYRICAIGGSDSHNYMDERYNDATEPSIPGDPSTFLYMEQLTPTNLLRALRQCNSFVTRHCKVKSNLMFGSKYGDDVREISYDITFFACTKIPSLFFICNGKKQICELVEVSVEGERSYKAKGNISFEDVSYNWIRFGAMDEEGNFMFYANPITKGEKTPSFQTFGEINDKLEQRWKSKEFYLTKTEH